MAENSKIEWCDHTFNPWVGCTKVSPACDHCYAEGWAKRTGQAHLWAGERRRTSSTNWQQPVLWNRKAEAAGIRARVFCASLADVFDNQVPSRWRDDLWHLISRTPYLDWLLLTKRPQNITKMLPDVKIGTPEWGDGWPNVWLGTTVENQDEADRRIPHLLATPATKRFLSCEPLLGPVDLTNIDLDGHHSMDALRPMSWRELWESDWDPKVTGVPLDESIESFMDEGGVYPPTDDRPAGVDWVIAGGESGQGARIMHMEWVRALRDQCHENDVPFFFKQWGEWAPPEEIDATPKDTNVLGGWHVDSMWFFEKYSLWDASAGEDFDHPEFARVGKKRAGAMLDGREWREMPE